MYSMHWLENPYFSFVVNNFKKLKSTDEGFKASTEQAIALCRIPVWHLPPGVLKQ